MKYTIIYNAIYGVLPDDKELKAEYCYEGKNYIEYCYWNTRYLSEINNQSRINNIVKLGTEVSIKLNGKEYKCNCAVIWQDYKKLPREEWGNIDIEVECFFSDSGPDVPKKSFFKRMIYCILNPDYDSMDGWILVDRGTFRKKMKIKDFVKFEKKIVYLTKDSVWDKQNTDTKAAVKYKNITMAEYLRLVDKYNS